DGDGDGDGEPVTGQLDLLFVVDNSGQMDTKQEFLASAVPELIDELTNASEGEALVQDLHVAVISSSLGGQGSESCLRGSLDVDGQPLHEDDGARLLPSMRSGLPDPDGDGVLRWRSEEHTSELQSRENLVCRLLLAKKE